MLAYVFWHRPAEGVAEEEYEAALQRFHGSLAHDPPSGLTGSATLRAAEIPWLAGDGQGYEDWYTVEGWSGLGVLEAAAVSGGHASAHHEAARRAGRGTAAVYRLVEGEMEPGRARLAAWVGRPAGQDDPTVGQMLGDGVTRYDGSLWQRCLVLGPAPEFCLLLDAEELPLETGLAPARLPAGWRATLSGRAPPAA